MIVMMTISEALGLWDFGMFQEGRACRLEGLSDVSISSITRW